MKVLKYVEYDLSGKMANELIESIIIGPPVNESNEEFKEILKKLSHDLKFNYKMVLTFGTSMTAFFPIVDKLIKNSNLKIELNKESLVLITISALSIIYIEGKKNLSKKDIKTILEELKLRGIGNNIIKKVVECFKSIGSIFKILFKDSIYGIYGLIDAIAYTSILVPTLNAIYLLIGNYNLTIDTLVSNFVSLGIGVGTFLAKHGINYLINKLKDKLPIKVSQKRLMDLEDPNLMSPINLPNDETKYDKKELIKEQ